VDFTAFLLSQLPPPPARVLEFGCGPRGGVTLALVEAGYDALGIDPLAPAGPRFRAIALEELEDGEFDAVVAERALHHVADLGVALDRIVKLAPLLVLDEFAWEQLDEPTRDWYESRYRLLADSGSEPEGPADLGHWVAEHDDLHTSGSMVAALRTRYHERLFGWRAYLYRWLGGEGTEQLEERLIAAGEIKPLGFRWVGTTTL
jgi:methyltransferase family protein